MLPSEPSFSVNQQRQQLMNRTLIINLLRRRGLCSRAELAKLSGLQPATLTKIIGEFVRCGLAVEEGYLEGDRGRRAIGVRINGKLLRVLGVMVTRTSYSILAMGLSGEVYDVQTSQIAAGTDTSKVIEDICCQLHQLITQTASAQFLAIGFAMPGPYIEKDGKLVFVTNLSGWDRILLHKTLQEKFQIPIFIENDANAGTYAQFWFREAEQSLSHLVYVVAGQGIGCGIFVNGDLLKGGSGIAGEIGHTTIRYDGPQCECGNRGCLEKYCSTLVLRARLRERAARGESTLPLTATMEDIAAALRADDAVVCEEYARACNFLAVGIVNLINQLNPNTVIIGDELALLAPELMLTTVRERVRQLVRPMIWNHLTIEVDHLPHNPILLGAGVVAAQKVFEDPFNYIHTEKGGG